VEVLLTRQSVAAGDDADEHDERIDVPSNISLEALLERVREMRYLASIQGGKATWSVWSDRALAVMAQEWESARLLPFAGDFFSHIKPKALHFVYHAQQDPSVVFDVLSCLDMPLRPV